MDDDESWQVQVAEKTQPENCLPKQTDQIEPVVDLDIIDYLSKDNFYTNHDDILNNDPCREESQKEPELKETDCCIQQVDCTYAQNKGEPIAPLQINLAQSEGTPTEPPQLGPQDSPATLLVAPLQLPSHETPFILPLQINLAQEGVPEILSGASFQLPTQISLPPQLGPMQKEETETPFILPMQTVHAQEEQMVVQWPKPKEHADQCLPKPPDKVEFVLLELDAKLQPPREKYQLKLEVLKNANIRAKSTPHLKEEKLIMLLHEYIKKAGWAMTKSKRVLHFLLNTVGTLFPSPIT